MPISSPKLTSNTDHPDTLATRCPLFINAQVFAEFLKKHGGEHSLMTIVQRHFERRKRKPNGTTCERCAGGHNAPCDLPGICDCLCTP